MTKETLDGVFDTIIQDPTHDALYAAIRDAAFGATLSAIRSIHNSTLDATRETIETETCDEVLAIARIAVLRTTYDATGASTYNAIHNGLYSALEAVRNATDGTIVNETIGAAYTATHKAISDEIASDTLDTTYTGALRALYRLSYEIVRNTDTE